MSRDRVRARGVSNIRAKSDIDENNVDNALIPGYGSTPTARSGIHRRRSSMSVVRHNPAVDFVDAENSSRKGR